MLKNVNLVFIKINQYNPVSLKMTNMFWFKKLPDTCGM